MIPLQGNESVVPEGWPLTLGRRGLVLQLGELEASALRLGECYLCIRSAAAVATTSGSGEVAAGETDERNTVEVSHVSLSSFSFLSAANCSRTRIILLDLYIRFVRLIKLFVHKVCVPFETEQRGARFHVKHIVEEQIVTKIIS